MSAPLYEIYRPRSLDDIIGQPKAVAALRAITARGAGGRCIFLSGPSGTGKTTLAHIVANTVADPEYITELVGRDLTPAFVRDLRHEMRLLATGKGGRAWIVNEIHGIPRASTELLLGVLEPVPSHVCFIATTTWDGEARLFDENQDAAPFLSRFLQIRLTNQGLAKAFAPRLRHIAQAAGLDGKPESAYVALMAECKNNPRAAIQAIESGRMMD